MGGAGGARRARLATTRDRRRVAHRAAVPSSRYTLRLLDRRRGARDGCAARRRVAQATGIRDDAVLGLLGHDAVAARTRKSEWRSLMLVRNRAARPRGGIAELEIETFLADVPVGPGSTPPERVRHVVSPRLLYGDAPVQLLATRRTNRRIESPRHYPDNDLVEVRRVVAWIPAVSGYSITPLHLDEGKSTTPLADPSVVATSESLDNGILRVQLETNGTISLASADGAWTIPSAVALEDVGDRGDLYTHSPFGPVRIEDRFLRARLVHSGPLRAEIETRWRIVVPSAADRRVAGARREGDRERGSWTFAFASGSTRGLHFSRSSSMA